jgi:hypothetical protein
MKVFTYALHEGSEQLHTGRLSPSYTHFGNYMRHWAQKHLPPGSYRAYIYEGRVSAHQHPSRVVDICIPPHKEPLTE